MVYMTSPPHYSGRLLELIVKARSICPPAVYYGHETPFQLQSEDKQHFQWFGKEFLNLPMRQSRAFFDKRAYNLKHLVKYPDE